MKKFKKETLYLAAIIAVVIAILVIVISGMAGRKDTAEVPSRVEVPVPSVKVEYVEKEKLIEVEVEKQITADILQDGLKDMGLLITGEYYFTEVVDYSSNKTLHLPLSINLTVPGSETAYTISYDGVVTAGIDFGSITVEKDDEAHTITVHVPKATIQLTDIDYDSFVLHAEKQSRINPATITDFNNSLVKLEANAKEKAVDRGLLKRADENAKTVIENFIGSLVDTNIYYIQLTND